MNSILFFLISLIAFNSPTEDCDCKDYDSIEQAFKSSDLVFWGKVDSISFVSPKETMNSEKANEVEKKIGDKKNSSWESPWIMKIEVKTKKIFKGQKKSKNFIIYTPRSGASCGFRFEKDKEYVIYASNKCEFYSLLILDNTKLQGFEKENTFWTNQCMNTGIYNKEEVKILKKLK